MKTSHELDKLAPAMAKAQSEMGGAVKDSKNPFFKATYADLKSVWKACKEQLHNNNISVIQSPIDREGRIGVSTMLLHSSGQFIKDEFTLGVKKQNDPQADGSTLTYARRYALASFVGICPVDDDGESAMLRNEPKKQLTCPDYIEKIDNLPQTHEKLSKWDELHFSKAEDALSSTDLKKFRNYIDCRLKDLEHPKDEPKPTSVICPMNNKGIELADCAVSGDCNKTCDVYNSAK